ncbi:hypothetical protein MO867_22600 [Microbulbifer sp. OS29]|uniref:Uncharacterized protein n=1 Tax=Microbulbifer okhotskensis TaxID=2926617 RepID=A0A9X2EW83_9GAMM|nr:hypothetical protein [Microbulbifer okhotskensis]MCO1337118.1 hypothetical protein [Microbulbifer okhotskensis]
MKFIFIFFVLFCVLFVPAFLIEKGNSFSLGVKLFVVMFIVAFIFLCVVNFTSRESDGFFKNIYSYIFPLFVALFSSGRYFYLRWIKLNAGALMTIFLTVLEG